VSRQHSSCIWEILGLILGPGGWLHTWKYTATQIHCRIFHQQNSTLHVYNLLSGLQRDSGKFWSGGQVMRKGAEYFSPPPKELSQLSSIIQDGNNNNNKCNHTKLYHYLQKTEIKYKILTWRILLIWNEILLSYLLT
jgi:hypothetical protein